MKYNFQINYTVYVNRPYIYDYEIIQAETPEEARKRFFRIHGSTGYKINEMFVESLNGWLKIL